MKASELRIGNYVMAINNYMDVFVIHAIYGQKFLNIRSSEYKNYETTIKDVKPIELTEEWMLEFGFKKDLDKSFMKNDISIFLDKRYKTNIYLQANDSGYGWFGFEKRIDYVHELQNLYFALTGEELTINN